jgi:hypothetical protein
LSRLATGTYSRIAELPLEVQRYELERLEQPVTRGFSRVTSVVRLHGDGEEGQGEDVTWHAEAHELELAAGPILPIAGRWTLDSFSDSLTIEEPWRRWAYESAALDLALRQAGRSFAAAVDREPRPVAFVVSPGLGEPPSSAPLRRYLELYPELRFKLDPGEGWTDELVAELAAAAKVVTVDMKAFYAVDAPPPDPGLYRRVAEAFPEAWIEDPALTPETERVLGPHRHRITWDAPIHSVADVEALPFQAHTLNSKPSRFGRLRALLDFYDWTEAQGIDLYGGGMFELGPGRGQIQYLASLFHPGGPNDVAPGGYNAREPQPGLPRSPLPPPDDSPGFRARLY